MNEIVEVVMTREELAELMRKSFRCGADYARTYDRRGIWTPSDRRACDQGVAVLLDVSISEFVERREREKRQ